MLYVGCACMQIGKEVRAGGGRLDEIGGNARQRDSEGDRREVVRHAGVRASRLRKGHDSTRKGAEMFTPEQP